MTDRTDSRIDVADSTRESVSEFTQSYASFNRIVNNLQRQYIDLEEEFTAQNKILADTNKKLIEMTQRNLNATEFLNSILQSISAGIVAVDHNGRVTHFNPAASLLFGLPVREPLGKPYREVIPPGDPVDANALRALEAGREIDGVEKVVELVEGTRLHLSVSTAVLRDDAGRVTGAVEVLHDLTRTRKMERELARLNTLAALGEMAATIAHEVRNPLAGIGGFAGLLKRDMDNDDPRQKLVNKICDGVESLNKTVTTLLNYTRVEEMKLEHVTYDQFLNRTIEQFRYDNARLLSQFKIDYTPAHGTDQSRVSLTLDPLLMRQLFFNLFTNAIEACGGSGSLELSHDILPRQKACRLYGDKMILGLDETVVATTFTDSGPGIPEDKLDRLFAPFFTTKQNGTGLGLAVVWKIAKSHGGEIIADNLPDRGARFMLLLPTKIDQDGAGMDKGTA